MRGYTIRNVKPFVANDNSNQTGRVIDFSYFHTQRGDLKRLINESSAENLPKDGSESMQGNIDINNHEILNLKEARPHYSFHAVNVNFVSKTISDNNATITAVYVSYVNTAKAELQELTKSLTDSLSRKSETCISALLLTRKMVLLMSSSSPIIGLSRSYPAFPNS